MNRLVVSVAASLITATFVVIVVNSWDLAGFAVVVTIRSIARVYVPYLEWQVTGLTLALSILGRAVKALSVEVAGRAAWRGKWLWRSVLIAVVCGVAVATSDAFTRELGIRGGLFEAVWAGTTLGALALVSLVACSSLERGAEALREWARRRA